ncbi:HET-domain-containing [Fusarium albosuccineum]|uniref:HET-domain-containing n=1 Tax=Fusarium albosuccineum TaxID=1237068 RepID=A0A8H4PH61_9HYPO|nr:HET-domain-containing [Fusarium albosuccineum]
MADGTSFSSAYQLKLYWKTEGLQKSVSIYPASFSFQIPPQYIKVVGRRVTQQVDVVWLATWLGSCGLIAPTKRPVTARSTSNTSTVFKIRLIDVQRGCLVEGNLDWAYACLSYVWGGIAIPKLTKERQARYSTENGIYENGMKAVQTITDAIKLVSCLGFRYLWVDALCIMQDDSVDISTYIPHMGHIYRGAIVTIVSDSRSANTGIPGISMPRPKSSATLNAHGYNLVASKMTLSESLATSTWFRRGWTLQEMCFSQCILLFTESQVFFQGDDSIYMEDGRIDTSGASYAGDSQNILARLEPDTVALPTMSRSRPPSTSPIMRSSTSNLVDPRTAQPSQRHEKEEYFLEGESSTAKYDREMQQRWYKERAQKLRRRLEAFSKYKQLVQAYAGRALTYERDILRAFEGVLEYFQGVLGPHIWGVPEE